MTSKLKYDKGPCGRPSITSVNQVYQTFVGSTSAGLQVKQKNKYTNKYTSQNN